MSAGGLPANSTATWDDVERVWVPWPTPIDQRYQEVSAIAAFDGGIAASGRFDRTVIPGSVAKWDGAAWAPLGSMVLSSRAYALFTFQGELHLAADRIERFDDGVDSVVARWTSTAWVAVGSGFGGGCFGNSMVSFQGALHLGGFFPQASGQTVSNIARWTGTAWAPLSSGVSNSVSAMVVYNGRLIVGGNFATASGVEAPHVAAWDGQAWAALGSSPASFPGDISVMAVFANAVYASGYGWEGTDATVLAWDGDSWRPLPSDIDGTYANGVNAMVATSTALFAGGSFLTADGIEVNGIARWNGEQWAPLGVPPGVDYAVYTLAAAETQTA